MDEEELRNAVRNAAYKILIKKQEKETRKKISKVNTLVEEMANELNNNSIKNKNEIESFARPVIEVTKEAMQKVDKIFTKHLEEGDLNNKEHSIAIDLTIRRINTSLYDMKNTGEKLVKNSTNE